MKFGTGVFYFLSGASGSDEDAWKKGQHPSVVVGVRCKCRLIPSLIDEFLQILVMGEVRQRITDISDALTDPLNIDCVLRRVKECLKQKSDANCDTQLF